MTNEYTIVGDSEFVEFRRKPKNSLGRFTPIGRINNMKYISKEPYDIFTRLNQVSKSAYTVFNELKDHHDPYTMFCYPPNVPKTKSQLAMYQSRIKELKDVGVIRKVRGIVKARHRKTGTYIINPYLIICPYDVKGTQRDWDDLA